MPFSAVFNAEGHKKLLDDKSKMQSLPAKEIRVNDIVVVEVFVRRYTKATDKSDNPWNSWRAKFELKCVSLLHRCVSASENHEDIAV
ncbi:hypothetical protein J3R82DRAFT_4281 [Butyriboletus roseoflavus]|nr:hypothetical protein J3R82DRAFT_4281 [Butyriboletus roseoflavus]